MLEFSDYPDMVRELEGLEKDKKAGVLRHLARTDLYFLLRFIFERKDVERKWLFDRIREVQESPNEHLDLWAREHYKLGRVNEPVPTPDGWKAHGDLDVGDEVFSPTGQPVKVLAKTELFESPPQHEITFDDGFKIVTGDDHLWDVERRTRKRIPGAYNKPGPKRLYREEIRLSTREIAAYQHNQDNRLAIPVAAPLDLPSIKLPIEPYLLGMWLGDGTSNCGSITCGDPEVFKYIRKLGYQVGEDKTPKRNAEYRKIDGLAKELKALDLIKNKHIPPVYLRSSIEQRLDLLRGLMDSDGHCNTRGTATFCNINQALIDGVDELCHSLGLKPSKRKHIGAHKGEPYPFYNVSFQAYKDLAPFKIQRKVERCKDGERPHPRRYIVSCERVDPEPGSCIQVEGGRYLIGERMIPTHNSTIITYGHTIFDILRGHGEGSDGSEPCVCIFSHSRPIAKAFLRQIMRELESNELLKGLFPDILYADPKKDSPKWSEDDGIVVKRKSNPAVSSIEAWGLVDGQPVSKHFPILVYDDVVTIKSVTSGDMIRKTTEALELSYNLGTDGGVRRFVGTIYDDQDTWQVIRERKTASPRIYPCTHNGMATGDPVLMSQGYLDRKLRDMGAFTFSTQMLLDPVPNEDSMFNRDDFIVEQDAPDLNLYICSDFAVQEAKDGGKDWTEHGVFGIDSEGRPWVIDWWSGQTTSDIWIDAGLDLVRDHPAFYWVGESGQIRRSVEPFLTIMMDERAKKDSRYIKMQWLPPIGKKPARMQAFHGLVKQKGLRLLSSPWNVDLINEMVRFPRSQRDHKADACSLFGRALMQTWALAIPEEVSRIEIIRDYGRERPSLSSWKTV